MCASPSTSRVKVYRDLEIFLLSRPEWSSPLRLAIDGLGEVPFYATASLYVVEEWCLSSTPLKNDGGGQEEEF